MSAVWRIVLPCAHCQVHKYIVQAMCGSSVFCRKSSGVELIRSSTIRNCADWRIIRSGPRGDAAGSDSDRMRVLLKREWSGSTTYSSQMATQPALHGMMLHMPACWG